MAFEVYRTTAEQVIGAADAALQRTSPVSEETVAVFLDTTNDFAREALKMAVQLSLLREKGPEAFVVASPCAKYLVTSVREEKAAVFRFLLEQYEPFAVFKRRLDLSSGVPSEAAVQTKAICGIPAHKDIVVGTLLDLGTYANALTSQGAGLYLAPEANDRGYLKVLSAVVADRAETEVFVRRALDRDAASWIDEDSVFESLVTAYLRLQAVGDDPKAPVVHAGNAFESFLSQLAAHYNTNVAGANGINSKAERLQADGHLTKKHKNVLAYIGHVRNAADHGVDAEINRQWAIRGSTAIEYVHVVMTAIRDLVDAKNGIYTL